MFCCIFYGRIFLWVVNCYILVLWGFFNFLIINFGFNNKLLLVYVELLIIFKKCNILKYLILFLLFIV